MSAFHYEYLLQRIVKTICGVYDQNQNGNRNYGIRRFADYAGNVPTML